MGDNDLKSYDMTNYLSDIMDEDPDELFAVIRMDLNEIKSQLLEEDACYVVFAGNKSIKTYQSFLPDLIGKGFVPGFADYLLEYIFVEKFEEKRKDYIILSDSLNSGTEVDRIIRLMEGNLIRVYSYFATSNAIDYIKNKHDVSDDQFICAYKNIGGEEYQKISKRLKLISHVYLSSEMTDDVGSFEIITKKPLIEVLQVIEKSISEVLGCNKVDLDKDPIYNLKTPDKISYFVFECCSENKNCSHHFVITAENPKLVYMDLDPLCIQILCKIEELSTGYLIQIYPDLRGPSLICPTSTDNCPIYKGQDLCALEISRSEEVLKNIIPIMVCMSCIKIKLTENAIQKIKTMILDNYDISL